MSEPSQIVDFLTSVPGFSAIDRDQLGQIVEQIEELTFDDGEYLMRRGEPGDHMFILWKGRVKVRVVDKASGETRMVVNLGSRDLVGEMALLTGDPRNADVQADGPVVGLKLVQDTLGPLLREYPDLAKVLTEILGRRLEAGGGIEWVGKYRLLGKLGEGATAKVYQALHPALNRVVAIKMLSHTLVYDKSFKDRFLQEARTIASLTHPNIVQIFDTEEAYRTYFIVMEKVSGTDLSKLLKARKVLSPEEAMDILRQMALALSFAHEKGVVHRDVKPANCAVDDEGVVKLMDFGIARRIPKNPTGARAKIVEGTPRYLAPEAAIGKEVDGRADIYSLGIMAYEMVTGRVPFYSDTIRDLLRMHVRKRPPDITRIRSGLPENLVRFINGALIKRPDERLTDWKQILELLSVPGDATGEISVGSPIAHAETDLLQISYPASALPEVQAAVEGMVRSLSKVPGLHLAHARLTPVAMPEVTSRLDSPGGLSAQTPPAGYDAARSWFARLTTPE